MTTKNNSLNFKDEHVSAEPDVVPLICCIDGNIGAGKSTILNKLKEEGYLVFEEDSGLSNWGTPTQSACWTSSIGRTQRALTETKCLHLLKAHAGRHHTMQRIRTP